MGLSPSAQCPERAGISTKMRWGHLGEPWRQAQESPVVGGRREGPPSTCATPAPPCVASSCEASSSRCRDDGNEQGKSGSKGCSEEGSQKGKGQGKGSCQKGEEEGCSGEEEGEEGSEKGEKEGQEAGEKGEEEGC